MPNTNDDIYSLSIILRNEMGRQVDILHAIQKLERIGGRRAARIISNSLNIYTNTKDLSGRELDKYNTIYIKMCTVLGDIGDKVASSSIADSLALSNDKCKMAGLKALTAIGDNKVCDNIRIYLIDKNMEVRLACADTLHALGEKKWRNSLLKEQDFAKQIADDAFFHDRLEKISVDFSSLSTAEYYFFKNIYKEIISDNNLSIIDFYKQYLRRGSNEAKKDCAIELIKLSKEYDINLSYENLYFICEMQSGEAENFGRLSFYESDIL